MDENKSDFKQAGIPGHPTGCYCYGCNSFGRPGFGRRFFLVRWLLGLIILLIVFWVGVKVGEFKAIFYGNDWGMPHERMMNGFRGFYPGGMMGDGNQMYYYSATTTPLKK